MSECLSWASIAPDRSGSGPAFWSGRRSGWTLVKLPRRPGPEERIPCRLRPAARCWCRWRSALRCWTDSPDWIPPSSGRSSNRLQEPKHAVNGFLVLTHQLSSSGSKRTFSSFYHLFYFWLLFSLDFCKICKTFCTHVAQNYIYIVNKKKKAKCLTCDDIMKVFLTCRSLWKIRVAVETSAGATGKIRLRRNTRWRHQFAIKKNCKTV